MEGKNGTNEELTKNDYSAVQVTSDVEGGKTDAKSPAPPKERLAYLDNVKFACMVAIFMMHSMSEPFAYCKDADFWDKPAPLWLTRVQLMHAEFGLPIFAFASGAVSKPDISTARLLAYTRALVLPVIFMFYWYQVIWYMPAGQEFAPWKVQQENLIGLHNNFLWYLKALFVWRLALMAGGSLPDWALVCISLVARSWMCTNMFGPEGPGFIGQTFLLFPFYIIGYVLFSKQKLMKPFVEFLGGNSVVRFSTLAVYLLLWIDVIFFGYSNKATSYIYGYMRFGKIAHLLVDLVRIPISLAYGFLATAWLPTQELPVLSEAGRQTLYCYMFNTTGVMVSYNFWRFLSRPFGPYWWTWVCFQPLVVLALGSLPVRFITWPFASPGWALKDPSYCCTTKCLDEATEEKSVKSMGLPIWFAITVLVHVAFVGGVMLWGSPRDCAVP